MIEEPSQTGVKDRIILILALLIKWRHGKKFHLAPRYINLIIYFFVIIDCTRNNLCFIKLTYKCEMDSMTLN